MHACTLFDVLDRKIMNMGLCNHERARFVHMDENQYERTLGGSMDDEWNMKCARGTKHNINIVIIYQLRIRNGCSVCRLILSYFPCVFLSIWWQAALTRLLAALHMNEQLALAKVIIMSELLQKKNLTWITSVFPGCCSHDSLIHAIHTQIHTIIIPTMPAYTRKWDRENIFRIFATVDATKQKKQPNK